MYLIKIVELTPQGADLTSEGHGTSRSNAFEDTGRLGWHSTSAVLGDWGPTGQPRADLKALFLSYWNVLAFSPLPLVPLCMCIKNKSIFVFFPVTYAPE